MQSMTKQEVKNVIEGKRTTERIPNICNFWIAASSFVGQEEEMQKWLDRQPYDVAIQRINMPSIATGTPEDPEYCWFPNGSKELIDGALDSTVYLTDWEDSDAVEAMFEKFPSADSPSVFAECDLDSNKYTLCQWFYFFFERHWSLRGMENALTDFYLYPDEVHRLYQKLADFYVRILERAKAEYNVDGIFTSDDIETQNAQFFSLDIFRTFFKPYYKQVIDKAHELGVHFWLHTCGNIELFMEDFIEIGLDVIHPIQKHTMDEKKIAENFGGRICFLSGFDVQRLIPFGTPEEVREEARFLIDTFSRPDGRFMMTFGNGSTPDWKRENIEALYDELAKH